jgi:hypothetical protein
MPDDPPLLLDEAECLRDEIVRALCTDHGHHDRPGGLSCRTCRRRADAIVRGSLAGLRKSLAEAQVEIERLNATRVVMLRALDTAERGGATVMRINQIRTLLLEGPR